MKIPKTLKIGGHTYKVTIQDPGDLPVDEAGHHDNHRNQIVLDFSLPQSQLEVTFLHEVFHALNSTIDHTLLDSLAEQLYQVFSDNKLFK